MTPTELLERLVALVPRPRVHQIIYHGCFAPNARLRSQVVTGHGSRSQGEDCEHDGHEPGSRRRHGWAEPLSLVFAVDVLACPRCKGWMQRIAVITQGETIRAVLRSVGLPTAPPEIAPAGDERSALDFTDSP